MADDTTSTTRRATPPPPSDATATYGAALPLPAPVYVPRPSRLLAAVRATPVDASALRVAPPDAETVRPGARVRS